MESRMKIDIGIEAKAREEIARGLSRVLADTYTLYLKTHNFHWNVTGPMFQTLHLMFETQYNELALAVDLVAERIRALGFPAPGTYKKFAELSAVKEDDGLPKAEDMIRAPRRGARDRGTHRARGIPGSRRRQRSTNVRSSHATHAGA